MADKTPAEKLRMKPGMKAALLHVPEGLLGTLGLPDGVEVVEHVEGADFVLDFASSQSEAEQRLAALRPDVRPSTKVWLGYPKGSKAAGLDISRDTIREFALTIGLVANANIAIDEVWSTLGMRPE